MKKSLVVFVGLLLCAMAFTACNGSNTYAKELEAEKKLIKDFIKRQNINIIDTLPDGAWGEKDFLEIDDNLYLHISQLGDTASDPVKYRDEINLRYRKYTLNTYADTTSYWTPNDAPFPVEFQYGVSNSSVCTAWNLAIGYMKYTGSEATVIVPSKLGEDQLTVTPYGYDLKLQIRTNQ